MKSITAFMDEVGIVMSHSDTLYKKATIKAFVENVKAHQEGRVKYINGVRVINYNN